MNITKNELDDIIKKHNLFLNGENGGARANLRGANLSNADLSNADLSGANLSGANLRDTDLRGADLSDANLRGANLRNADLSGANLRGANLRGANLGDANLRGANLSDTDLRGANLDYSTWPLWCGSLNAKIDKRIACQLVYHAIRAMQSLEDDECKSICNDEKVINLANKFHRADECGKIEVKK